MDNSVQGTNPYLYALSCISGKWKMSILNHISYYGFIRFSKTRKTFPVSEKVLSQQLKELVADGLVERIQYNEIPLRVEYHLTDAGKKIMPALDLIYVWSINRMREENIQIDPDAFAVHPETKYEVTLKQSLEQYDDICSLLAFANENKLSVKDILHIVESSKEASL
ncbi:MAG: winged helix-turn-helix transcriptional regulator [Emergencia sp.]|nr:winged helix-turn-helix transcriptional regulator [Emergencia sp.]